MNLANTLYTEFMTAYVSANDAEVLRLYKALEGNRLAKAKRDEVEQLHRMVTKALKFEAFHAKYHDKTFAAMVDWFSARSGEGSVTLETGLRLDIFACNIVGRKTWYPETACVYYTEGQEVQIKVDVHSPSAVFAIGLTPGTLDVEAWENIKDKNLAFRCNDVGELTTGLFA